MKKLIVVSLTILLLIACKKIAFSPEGPTDIRIRNLSDQTLTNVIVSTSENTDDIDTIGIINKGEVSEYFRFKKAYPDAEISAKIYINGTWVTFTTGPVNYTYLTYFGQDRITYEIYISNLNNHELKISNRIIEEPLILN